MDDIAGARQKLHWANHHVEQFESGFGLFLRENPQRLAFDPDPAGSHEAKFIRSADLPPALICTVGDAVHNLRSALDHLAFAVAKRNNVPNDLLGHVNFTIREKAGDFHAALNKREIAAIGTAWRKFLCAEEPYHGGKGEDLCVVAALDNLDKHRNLLVVDTPVDTFTWDDALDKPVAVQRGLSFKDGVKIALDPADPDYHTLTQTRVVIRETVPGLDPDAWANEILNRLVSSVRGVIDRAEATAALWP